MPNLIRFGRFELDLEAAELRTNGRSLRLPEQQFQILYMLLQAAGGVVSREEIPPEEFDLNRTNEDLYHLRRWLGKRRGKNLQSAFSKGDLVRVKPGVVHDRYPDIPLGGWVGKIKRIGWLTPIAYAIHWTKPTLDQAHPVYFKRCQRDNLIPHRQWLRRISLRRQAMRFLPRCSSRRRSSLARFQ